MNREIKVAMTPRLILWAVFYQLRPLLVILTLVLMALSWESAFQIHKGAAWTWQLFITPVFLIFFFAWLAFLSYRNTMVQIRKLKTPVIQFRFTDDFLYVKTDLSSGENSWAVFKGLQKHAKVWRIVLQSGTALILPAEGLDDELKAFLSGKLPSLKRAFWKGRMTLVAIWLVIFVLAMYFLKHFHHD